MSSNQGNTPYRDLLTASIYWIILGIFLYSYFQTRNPLSLSVATDRVVDALSISFIFLVNRIARKPGDEYHSYGFHRAEVILNTTVILLFVAILFTRKMNEIDKASTTLSVATDSDRGFLVWKYEYRNIPSIIQYIEAVRRSLYGALPWLLLILPLAYILQQFI